MLNQQTQEISPALELFAVIRAGWAFEAIATAARLQIADHLKEQPLSLSALAEKTRLHPDMLFRFLRALCALNIFRQRSDQTYELTDLSEFLCTDVPWSFVPIFEYLTHASHRNSWECLGKSIQTGRSGFQLAHGKEAFEKWKEDTREGEVFSKAMNAFSLQEAYGILWSFDFSGFLKVCDLGGGLGDLLCTLLGFHQNMQGILLDLEAVIQKAAEREEIQRLGSRCELKSGNLFESIPQHCDIYLMKNILHDWDDAQCKKALFGIRSALGKKGVLLVIDIILPEVTVQHEGLLMDLEMMVMTAGGKERTEKEFRQLFQAADLQLKKIYNTPFICSIMEVVSVDPA